MLSEAKKLQSRRTFISRLSILLSLPLAQPLLTTYAMAKEEPWETKLKQNMKDNKPIEGKVSIELPDVASHGNLVPIKISVVSSMTEEDYVETITLLSNQNASPVLAEFNFSPLSGKAECSTTLRLMENQEVIALAKTNGGKFYLGRRQAYISISKNL